MLQRLKRVAQGATFNKIALAICALIWGYSFFTMKEATGVLPVFWLLMLRFGIATLCTLVFFGKSFFRNMDRKTVVVGVLLGVFEWLGYAFQTVGLTMTTPGKNAFITGTYVVMVPFLAWAFRMGKPHRYDVVAALLCLGGMALVLSDAGPELNLGDLLTVCCALFYALQLVEVSKYGGGLSVPALTCWQFLVMTVLSGVLAAFEPAPALSVFTPSVIGQLLFFGVVCSFIALTVMNYSFTKVDPSEGALIASLESPFGALFSLLAGFETISGRVEAGFALILVALAVSNGWAWFKRTVLKR